MEFSSVVGYELSGDETNYSFPTFFYSSNGKKFYFKSLSLELGSLNFVIGGRKTGKSLFLKSLTGLECPNEKPLDQSFLKYDVVYKPENIQPKFNGTLNQLIKARQLEENKNFIKNFNLLGLNKYLDSLVKSLTEENKQLLSFVLFLATEGLIYIMDSPTHIITIENRRKMLLIYKNYCENNDKIGLITEDNVDLVDEIFDENIDKKYFIRRFGENEYFGGDSCVLSLN